MFERSQRLKKKFVYNRRSGFAKQNMADAAGRLAQQTGRLCQLGQSPGGVRRNALGIGDQAREVRASANQACHLAQGQRGQFEMPVPVRLVGQRPENNGWMAPVPRVVEINEALESRPELSRHLTEASAEVELMRLAERKRWDEYQAAFAGFGL